MDDEESFYNYWSRFKKMLAKCPRHQTADQDLIQYFVKGLRPTERQLVSAACGGSILNKQPSEVFKLLGDMAEESRDDSIVLVKTTPATPAPLPSDSEMGVLCSTFKQLMEMMKHTLKRSAKGCQSCCGATHTEDEYSTLADEEEEVNAFGHNNNNNGGNQGSGLEPRYDPYNSSWKNHENLRYGGNHYQAPPGQQSMQARGPSLAETVHHLSTEQQKIGQELEKFKTETFGAMQTMVTQLAQLVGVVTKLDQKQGDLSAKVQVQPNAQVNAISLRSGKLQPDRREKTGQEKVEIEDAVMEEEAPKAVTLPKVTEKKKVKIKPPFLGWIANDEEDKYMRYMIKIFKKMDINIPLIKVLKSTPRCAKILIDLFGSRIRYTDDATFRMGERVSTVLKRDLPVKCKDPGIFAIPCVIGTTKIEQAMLDLGASINVMPLSIYHELNMGPLKPSRAVIELADKSSVYPEGVIEDVLVKVQDLIFPATFYVLNMGNTQDRNQLMLLGRPFLITARTVIDCDTGKLTCKFGGETVTFDIHKVEQHPPDSEVADLVDFSEKMVEDVLPKIPIEDEYEMQGVWIEQEPSGEALTKDKTKAQNQMADQLSKISQEKDGTLIKEPFLDELFGMKGVEPWYADLFNNITIGHFPWGMTQCQGNKVKEWDPGQEDSQGK